MSLLPGDGENLIGVNLRYHNMKRTRKSTKDQVLKDFLIIAEAHHTPTSGTKHRQNEEGRGLAAGEEERG